MKVIVAQYCATLGNPMDCSLSGCSVSGILQATIKNLPAMQEILVQCMGWEEPLEKGMATHSSILVRRIPWTEESGGL